MKNERILLYFKITSTKQSYHVHYKIFSSVRLNIFAYIILDCSTINTFEHYEKSITLSHSCEYNMYNI